MRRNRIRNRRNKRRNEVRHCLESITEVKSNIITALNQDLLIHIVKTYLLDHLYLYTLSRTSKSFKMLMDQIKARTELEPRNVMYSAVSEGWLHMLKWLIYERQSLYNVKQNILEFQSKKCIDNYETSNGYIWSGHFHRMYFEAAKNKHIHILTWLQDNSFPENRLLTCE